ncbi:alpha-isopropylmalate synthase regulatory domain-containing protein [Methylocaldum sp.]|uniref:alpha-isopropylmalate synthase regulatory domain-containing protein n=1 Tax=Methylocaldum sp. TaxID=1969727 RepID=UPI002D7880FB|nr:alpha-isopropylmalate synthase regulatory domain-containing protein [Methylocaldum sp.]
MWVQSYEERSTGQGAAAFVEVATDGMAGTSYSVGIDASIVTASVLAIIGAVNRSLNGIELEARQRLIAVLQKTV